MPETIKYIPFGELLKKVVDNRGRTCPTAISGIPLIATNCIKNESLYPVFEKVRYVSDDIFETWFRGHPEPDDIIFVNKGTPGRVCLAPNPLNFCIAQDMVAIRADDKKVYPKYLFAALRSINVQSEIQNLHVGSLIPHFKKSDFNDLKIPLPDNLIQKYIGDLYYTISLKINLLQRQNQTVEKLASALFKEWFIEEAQKQSEKQLLLGDLIDSVSITHSFPNDKIVFLNTSDIYLGNVLVHETVDVKSLPGQAKKTIQKNDILFSEIRPANGRYAFIDFDAKNYVVSTKLMVLRSKNILSQAFIYFYLTNTQTLDWLQMLAESRSGTFPQITFEQLKDLKINMPDDSIIENAINFCESAIQKLKSNYKQITTLTKLRDTLLQKLMSGELKV